MGTMIKFLDRYLVRGVCGVVSVLGLVAAVSGFRTGQKVRDCLGVAVCAIVAGIYAFLPRRERVDGAPYVSPYVVRFDENGVEVFFKGKPHESVLWKSLVFVGITIVDEFLPQPYWMLAGTKGKGGCVYPSDAAGAQKMLRELQTRLVDFDDVAVVRAMGMMSGGVVVWEKPEWKSQYRSEFRVLTFTCWNCGCTVRPDIQLDRAVLLCD